MLQCTVSVDCPVLACLQSIMAKTKNDPVVEDVDDDEISSDDDSDDVPELEEADGSARGKQSKMEKKSRYLSASAYSLHLFGFSGLECLFCNCVHVVNSPTPVTVQVNVNIKCRVRSRDVQDSF